jgi:hypothetical protein
MNRLLSVEICEINVFYLFIFIYLLSVGAATIHNSERLYIIQNDFTLQNVDKNIRVYTNFRADIHIRIIPEF